MSIDELMMQAGQQVANDYVDENVNRLVPFHFPNEHDHIKMILASALQTKHGYGYKGGSFVTHLVNNELYESLASADILNQKYIALLAAGVRHIQLDKIQKVANELEGQLG